MVNTDPGSQVPLIVGVLSLVMSQLVGLAIVGVDGAVVSMMIGIGVAGLVFPAVSVDVTERVFIPSGRGVVRVKLQLPELSAVTVPIVAQDAFFISTVELASAVPEIVGVVSFVRYELVVSPATFEITGAVGGRESTVNTVAVGVLVFHARSVRVTL
jgi:hypothetical protein